MANKYEKENIYMSKQKKVIVWFMAFLLTFMSFATTVEGASKGYEFKYGGVKFYIHGESSKLIEKLGTPNKKTKSASCAYDGEDIKYEYKDLIVYTYSNRKGGTEYIQGIKFCTSNVETNKGVKIGDSKKLMIKKYGRNKGEFDVYTYKKKKMAIVFTVDEGTIEEIEYVAY